MFKWIHFLYFVSVTIINVARGDKILSNIEKERAQLQSLWAVTLDSIVSPGARYDLKVYLIKHNLYLAVRQPNTYNMDAAYELNSIYILSNALKNIPSKKKFMISKLVILNEVLRIMGFEIQDSGSRVHLRNVNTRTASSNAVHTGSEGVAGSSDSYSNSIWYIHTGKCDNFSTKHLLSIPSHIILETGQEYSRKLQPLNLSIHDIRDEVIFRITDSIVFGRGRNNVATVALHITERAYSSPLLVSNRNVSVVTSTHPSALALEWFLKELPVRAIARLILNFKEAAITPHTLNVILAYSSRITDCVVFKLDRDCLKDSKSINKQDLSKFRQALKSRGLPLKIHQTPQKSTMIYRKIRKFIASR